MSLRFALLGLLDEEPSSGYDLARRFTEGIGAFAWGARHSQIYPELKKLHDEDLVTVTAHGARGRKVYDVTAAGRSELRGWLASPPSGPGTVRNEFLLRLFLLSSLETPEALGVLARVQTFAAEQIDLLEAERAAVDDPASGPALAATFGIYSYAATRDWADWAVQQLRTRAPSERPASERRADPHPVAGGGMHR